MTQTITTMPYNLSNHFRCLHNNRARNNKWDGQDIYYFDTN